MEWSQNLNINFLLISLWTILKTLFVTTISILIVWYIKYLWGRRKLYLYSTKVPGPLSPPLIGSAIQFAGDSHDTLKYFSKLFITYPGICRFWIGPRLCYGISDPNLMESLLPHCLKKALFYRHTEVFMGHGLFSAPDVNVWRKHRKLISPTFNQKILDGFVEVFTQQADILLEQLKKYSGKGEIDLFHVVSNCTLDTICETAMGVSVNAQQSNLSFSKWLDKAMEVTFVRMFVMWYDFDAIFNMTKLSKVIDECAIYMVPFISKVVRDKKEIYELSKQDKPDNTFNVIGRQKNAFLDYLLEITSQESNFTEKELRDEVKTFIAAGSDTTATTICFTLMTLGLYPDLQEKVYKEIMDVLGPDRKPEPSDLPNMVYLDLFIKETLRLFPVGILVGRHVEEDVNIADCIIPQGSTLIFGILHIHRDEKYWPDPLKFIPERFLPEEVAKRHPCTYIPFSYGPRNCIGQKYATMALKSILATVIRKFEVFTSYKCIEEIELTCNVVVRPKDGYKVSVLLRGTAE